MDPISAIFTISEDQLQVVLKKMAAGQTLKWMPSTATPRPSSHKGL